MTTRRIPPTLPRPAAVVPAPPPPDAPIPIPGTTAFAQGLSDWNYGPTPPVTPDEQVLWRQYFQTHIGLLPPAERERTRRVFKPRHYPQTITQHGTLAGIVTALVVMQLAPRLLGNTDSALALPLPLAVALGFAAMYGMRESLWSAWHAQFRALNLNPPVRPRAQRKRKGRS